VIRLGFVGGGHVQLDEAGDLLVRVASGQVRQAAPVVYQEEQDGRQGVAGGYALTEQGENGFALGTYDPKRLLINDSMLVYSTSLGGSRATGIAVDGTGNAYGAGTTNSSNFPTTPGAFQPTLRGGADAFVSKLNPSGTALVYSTFHGGSGGSSGANAIAVDPAGNAYVTRFSFSADFPTTPGALQRSLLGTRTRLRAS
jgi:hypothetical protein